MGSRVVIRSATEDERPAIERLALLDDRRLPEGDVVVAEVDGELWAAAPIGGGAGVADPFRPSGEVLAALRIAARKLGEAKDGWRYGRRRGRLRPPGGRYLRRGGATALHQVHRARA